MARIRNIKLTINAVEYQCRARSCNLEAIENVTLCTDNVEYELTAEIEITYGASGTYNLLEALAAAGTPTTFVVAPIDAAAAATNPTQTFSAVVPHPPKIIGSPGEIGTFTLVTQSEGGVVETVA